MNILNRLFKLSNLLFIFLLISTNACGSQDSNPAKLEPKLPPTVTATLSTTGISTKNNTNNPANSTTPTLVSGTPSLQSVTNLPKFQDWQRRWLKGILCRPPCFEGIIPGQTSVGEAVILLNNNPAVKDVSNNINSKVLSWNWIADKTGVTNTSAAYALYDPKSSNQTIFAIRPTFSIIFKLKDIVDIYGEPSHIIATADFDYDHINQNYLYNLVLIYLNNGFAITSYIPFKDRPIINLDLELQDIAFFIPSKIDSLSVFLASNNYIVPWQGYKDFEFYCLAADNNNIKCKK